MTIETILLAVALLLVASIIASTASHRLGIPALVFFLAIGMLAGSDGLGGIAFDNAWQAQSVGVVALAYILFSGGMDTDWRRIRPVLSAGLLLANVGVAVSALLVAGFVVLVLDFTPIAGLLLGAIVSSTDAAAVFSVMRTRGVRLRGDLEPLIELESGSNDPIAVFLTIGLTGLLSNPGASLIGLVPAFVMQMAIGALGGYLFGVAMTWLINRLRLRQEGLYPVLTLALVLLTYSATAELGGNGFLAVYLAGIVIGNRDFVHKRSLMRFHDGIAWLMQIGMFLVLGLLVFPSRLVPVAGAGLLVSAFLIVVARPLSVFAALALTRLGARDKLMVAWSGLRGSVPIVLATYPLLEGVANADLIFHLVFFIVLTSVVIQGSSIGFVAKLLGVQDSRQAGYRYPLEFVPEISQGSQLSELAVPRGSSLDGRSIVEIGLPRGALVVLVRRGDESIVPNGGTILEADDRLVMLADGEALASIQLRLAGEEEAATG